MSDPASRLPAHPSLEQLRKQAKDLLRAARANDAAALARFNTANVRTERAPILSDAQFVVAREYGFPSWPKLVDRVRQTTDRDGTLRPLIRPSELHGRRPYTLQDGTTVTTDDVYNMFAAARAGDLREVRSLVKHAPGLAVVEYNYTPPIHFSVREGHLAITELLIDRGADIAYKSYPFGDSLLTYADEHEHHDVAALLRRLLARRFAIAPGVTELINAARAGDLIRVRTELARDGSLARKSNDTGETALHQAAHNGHAEIVQLLLDAGADPDALRGDGYRPIHLALMPNWRAAVPPDRAAQIVDTLLARGVRYTMFIAASRGDHDYVRDALRRDRSLANDEDSCRRRPISAAAWRGDLALVRLLLEHGADPSAPEEGAPRGHALWRAVHDKRIDLVKLLLAHGADPNGMVESSGTPMMQAHDDAELRELLRAHGGIEDRNPRDRTYRIGRLIAERKLSEAEALLRQSPELLNEAHWGDGVLAGPARDGDHELIDFLMRVGARVPPVSKWAPFYYFKHEATAAFLLERGMDPNHMNWHRFTLLHHVAAEGELGKARLLLDHGADIDVIDEEYRSTPLGVAARRGQIAMVELLLERGADPTASGESWATPLNWAKKNGHDRIVELLRAAEVEHDTR